MQALIFYQTYSILAVLGCLLTGVIMHKICINRKISTFLTLCSSFLYLSLTVLRWKEQHM